MVIVISCIDKNLDLRLALNTKRIISALQDDEMHNIRNIVNSAILDPEVKGGLRWPLGKACFEDRYSVIGVWHTIAKKYKSPSLSLKARHVDRFDFKVAIGESTFEVNLKLRRIVSHLQVLLFVASMVIVTHTYTVAYSLYSAMNHISELMYMLIFQISGDTKCSYNFFFQISGSED